MRTERLEPYSDEWDYNVMMSELKCKALRKIEATGVSPVISEDLANIVAWAYREEDEAASGIVEYFGLDEKHLASILSDAEWLGQTFTADYYTSRENAYDDFE